MCTVVASSTAVSDAGGARKLGQASIGLSVAGIVIAVVCAIIAGVLVAIYTTNTISSAAGVVSSSSFCSDNYYLGTCYKYRDYVGYFGDCSGEKDGSYCYHN